jgi:hypothetical protein
MSASSVTVAMTRTGPAQRGQYLKSIANNCEREATRLFDRSSIKNALRRGICTCCVVTDW